MLFYAWLLRLRELSRILLEEPDAASAAVNYERVGVHSNYSKVLNHYSSQYRSTS